VYAGSPTADSPSSFELASAPPQYSDMETGDTVNATHVYCDIKESSSQPPGYSEIEIQTSVTDNQIYQDIDI